MEKLMETILIDKLKLGQHNTRLLKLKKYKAWII